MDFNYCKSIILLAVLGLAATACTPFVSTVPPDHKAENLIGIPLSQNSKLQSATEDDSDKVVVFDKTIRKVHHFDLDTSAHLGIYPVEQPDEDHFLVYGSGKKYFIDMTKKHVSIQGINGPKNPVQIKFVGTPISATYDAEKGYLVVYDSLQSVLFFKIDETGNIVSSFVSGPEIKDKGTIQAGDISAGGKLILSIRGTPDVNSPTVVDFVVSIDIDAALTKQTLNDPLVMTQIPTTLTGMSWIAPVTGAANLIMIKSTGNISVMNLDTQTVTSLPTDDWVVEKYSKIKDSHIVMRKSYDFYAAANGNVERRLYFVEGTVLKTKTLTKNFNFILNSHLDLKRGHWNVTKANTIKEYDVFNEYNGFFTGRSFSRIRMDDLLSVVETDIDDKATIEIASDFLFALYPSSMGYATRTDIDTNRTNIIRNFNVKELQ